MSFYTNANPQFKVLSTTLEQRHTALSLSRELDTPAADPSAPAVDDQQRRTATVLLVDDRSRDFVLPRLASSAPPRRV
jgi:hypothetical protein